MKARLGFAAFIVAGLVVALALAFLVSPEASSEPDGLDKVAIDEGFADAEEAHPLEGLPTAGYAVRGIDDDRLGTGAAGVIGIAVTFTATVGLALLVGRRNRRPSTA
jgi:PDGLE domain